MERVTMTAHGNGGKDDIPFNFPDVVTVTLKNGVQYSHSVSTAKGHADNPLSEAQLLGKFQECARLVLPEGDVERLGGIIARLDKLEELSGLMSILRRASSP
jgi:2-methylcitrate dehydratase PrpD